MSATSNATEFLICAYTLSAEAQLNMLIFGNKDELGITYVGKSSKGFEAEETQRKLLRLLKPLTTDICPLYNFQDSSTGVHWVKPVLVCEVKHYDTKGKESEFLWLREDKNIHDHTDEIK